MSSCAESGRWLHRLVGATSLSVLRNSMAVITIGAGVKALALLKERAIGTAYGASAEIDGFLLAFAVPSFALTVFSTSFATALVPQLILTRGEADGHSPRELARLAIGLSLIGAILLTLVLAVLGETVLRVVAFGFDPGRLAAAVGYYHLLLAVFLFGALKETLAAVMSSYRRFVAPALAPIITTAVTVVMIWTLGADWGVTALASATSIGFAGEAAFIAAALALARLPFTPRWRGMARRLRPVFRQTAHLALGALLMGGATVVDLAMATLLAEGEVAILSYGTRLTAVGVTLLGTMATVCLPYFSGLVAAHNFAAVRRTLAGLSAWAAAATVPVALLLVLLSEPLIALIYQGGSFSAAEATAAARVQAMFALQVPFYVLTLIGMRLITAFGRNAVVALISLLFFLANAAGNWLLLPHMGAAGIALATSIAYALTAAAAAGYLVRFTRPG